VAREEVRKLVKEKTREWEEWEKRNDNFRSEKKCEEWEKWRVVFVKHYKASRVRVVDDIERGKEKWWRWGNKFFAHTTKGRRVEGVVDEGVISFA